MRAILTQRLIGDRSVDSIPQLWLEALCPRVLPEINLNTCADPDCGNYGVEPDFAIPVLKGSGSEARRQNGNCMYIPALTTGSGKYTLTTSERYLRVSGAFEYKGQPARGAMAETMVCDHQKRKGTCGISFDVLSNEHFPDELYRLRTENGLVEGPVCRHCGARYLERPDEFIFNGTHGKITSTSRSPEKPAGFRIIHKPCKGKSGARMSAFLDHKTQVVKRDNVRLLRGIVNGLNLSSQRRLIADPDTGGLLASVGRVIGYFGWRKLLAFEKAKLAEWKTDKKNSIGSAI